VLLIVRSGRCEFYHLLIADSAGISLVTEVACKAGLLD
jgi:hypothetical protein